MCFYIKEQVASTLARFGSPLFRRNSGFVGGPDRTDGSEQKMGRSLRFSYDRIVGEKMENPAGLHVCLCCQTFCDGGSGE